MNNPTTGSTSDPNPPTPVPTSGWLARNLAYVHKSWRIALAVAAIMVALALVGVGLSTSSREMAPKYWLTLVPVYGVLCTGFAWYRAKEGESTLGGVVRQGFHWLFIAGAVALDFYMQRAGEESGTVAGQTALLVLALGCLLAGVHFEWLFAFVGILLLATLVLVVKADQYLWLIFIFGGLFLVGALWLMRWMNRHHASAKVPGRP